MSVRSNTVTVTDAATLLTVEDVRGNADNPTRVRVFNNDASVAMFVGGDDVTTANGVPVLAQTSSDWELLSGENLYGIVASGTLNARVGMSRV